MEVKKGEEFKTYLNKAGIVDQITRSLVGLYQEPVRPPNAIEFNIQIQSYMRKYLNCDLDIDVVKLKSQFDQMKHQNFELEEEIQQLQLQLENLLNQQQMQEQ